MLVLRVDADPTYYNIILKKFKRVVKRSPIHVDIFLRKETVYIMSLDDGLSAAFLYSAYLKAVNKNLKAELMYARHIDPSFIPNKVKKIAEVWLSKGLSRKEIETLKNITITEHVLERWL